MPLNRNQRSSIRRSKAGINCATVSANFRGDEPDRSLIYVGPNTLLYKALACMVRAVFDTVIPLSFTD